MSHKLTYLKESDVRCVLGKYLEIETFARVNAPLKMVIIQQIMV
ncbi:hypothetical protein [Thiomicrorhabdus hydrogeniphila]